MRIVRQLGFGLALLALSAAPAFAGGYGGETYGDERHGDGESYSRQTQSSEFRGEEAEAGYHAWGGGMRRVETSGAAWRYRRIEEEPRCWTEGDARAFDRRDLPACGPEEVVLQPGFFVGGGGVGGFPEVVDYGGGGGGVVFAGAGARASAFASASARVSISFRGGFRGGGRHGGGCGCR